MSVSFRIPVTDHLRVCPSIQPLRGQTLIFTLRYISKKLIKFKQPGITWQHFLLTLLLTPAFQPKLFDFCLAGHWVLPVMKRRISLILKTFSIQAEIQWPSMFSTLAINPKYNVTRAYWCKSLLTVLNVLFQKISILPPRRFLFLVWTPTPLEIPG